MVAGRSGNRFAKASTKEHKDHWCPSHLLQQRLVLRQYRFHLRRMRRLHLRYLLLQLAHLQVKINMMGTYQQGCLA